MYASEEKAKWKVYSKGEWVDAAVCVTGMNAEEHAAPHCTITPSLHEAWEQDQEHEQDAAWEEGKEDPLAVWPTGRLAV